MSFYGVAPIQFEPVTAVTATPSVEVGTQRVEGSNHYVYVYNDANSTIPTAQACVLQSGATGMSVTVSSVTSADFLIGVAVNTISTAYYGWVVARGITSVKMGATSGTVAAGDLIHLADNGLFVPVSNATGSKDNVCGKALAAIASSATGSAFISCY